MAVQSTCPHYIWSFSTIGTDNTYINDLSAERGSEMNQAKKNLSIFMACLVISLGFGWVMTYSGWDSPVDFVRQEVRCDDGSRVLVRVGHETPASCRVKDVAR
jgi:hypothetical protein